MTKLEQMKKEWRNIPFTKAEIEVLPLGFSPTSFKPTKNFSTKGSKFIKKSKYN